MNAETMDKALDKIEQLAQGIFNSLSETEDGLSLTKTDLAALDEIRSIARYKHAI